MTRSINSFGRAGFAVLLLGVLVSQAAVGEVISHWSFDTDLSDSSGNGHDGTAVNGAAVSSSYSAFGGSSLNLNGADKQYVQVANPAIQQSSFTIAAWVRPETLENDWTDIFGYWSGSAGNNYPFSFFLRSDNKVHVFFRPNINELITTQTYDLLNTWNHVAVTWDRDAKTMRIYVNGVEGASASTDAANVDMQASVSDWTIGRKDDSTTPYDGYIDELWVFDEALSADQVDRLMEVNVVPEPSTMTLLLLGSLVGLFVYRRRKR